MAKRVILAVAGAGKTYHICHEIDPQKRNLILAFTHENIHNIQKELYDAYKCMPELTTVATFDSFVYHELILPYEPSIGEHFGQPGFVSCGICMIDPPPQRIKTKQENPLRIRFMSPKINLHTILRTENSITVLLYRNWPYR